MSLNHIKKTVQYSFFKNKRQFFILYIFQISDLFKINVYKTNII